MICKGCGKQADTLSASGFCDAGICRLREEGYKLGLQEGYWNWAVQNHRCCYGNHDSAELMAPWRTFLGVGI